MAFASDSTTAPTRPLLPFVFRPAAPVDDPRSADDLLAEIAAEIDRQVDEAAAPKAGADDLAPTGIIPREDTLLLKFQEKPELPPEPLLPADAPHGAAGDARHGGAPISHSSSGERIQHRVEFDLDAAHALHLRRQLAQAAEHGAALLAALGLPRLVEADFVPLDPVAIGDALDVVISHLDAMDGDADLEPNLAGYYNSAVDPNGEREADSDDEPSFGAPENHPGHFHFDMEGHYHVGRAHHPLGDQTTWTSGSSWDNDAEAVNEDADDLDPGEMQEGELEPWLAAPEGSQHYRGGDLDLEQDGEIERPWWGRPATGWNDDGARYA